MVLAHLNFGHWDLFRNSDFVLRIYGLYKIAPRSAALNKIATFFQDKIKLSLMTTPPLCAIN